MHTRHLWERKGNAKRQTFQDLKPQDVAVVMLCSIKHLFIYIIYIYDCFTSFEFECLSHYISFFREASLSSLNRSSKPFPVRLFCALHAQKPRRLENHLYRTFKNCSVNISFRIFFRTRIIRINPERKHPRVELKQMNTKFTRWYTVIWSLRTSSMKVRTEIFCFRLFGFSGFRLVFARSFLFSLG